MKEEVGEDMMVVEVDNGTLGAGGGRGERQPPLEEVQEEGNEKEGMDEELNKEEAEQVEEEKNNKGQRWWAERCRGRKWRKVSILWRGCRRRKRREMRRRSSERSWGEVLPGQCAAVWGVCSESH